MNTQTKKFGLVREISPVYKPVVESTYQMLDAMPQHYTIHFQDGSSVLLPKECRADIDQDYFPSPVKISYSTYMSDGREWANEIEIVTDEQQEASPVGLRYTEGKLRMDLIHPDFLRMIAEIMTESPELRLDLLPKIFIKEVAVVFTEGTKKYPARNWEKGMPWSKVIGPLWRHWLKWLMGAKRDAELPSCHHLAQLAWNAAVLMEFENTHPEQDDRTTSYPDWTPKDSV